MTLFQPLWPTRPSPADIRRGREEIQRARDNGPPTERERLFVDAGAAFFREPDSLQYMERIHDWLQGWNECTPPFPRTTRRPPGWRWLSWRRAPRPERRGSRRIGRPTTAAGGVPAASRSPRRHALPHPCRRHARAGAREAEVVSRYAALAPRNPHALHMPTHIYTRLGEWDRWWGEPARGGGGARASGRKRAAGVGRVPPCRRVRGLRLSPMGDEKAALAQVRRLRTTSRWSRRSRPPSISPRPRRATRWSGTTGRRRPRCGPGEPATLDWDKFAWAEAVTWFAKGLGASHFGKVDAAREAVGRMGELKAVMERAGEPAFAAQIGILRLGASGWMNQAAGSRTRRSRCFGARRSWRRRRRSRRSRRRRRCRPPSCWAICT